MWWPVLVPRGKSVQELGSCDFQKACDFWAQILSFIRIVIQIAIWSNYTVDSFNTDFTQFLVIQLSFKQKSDLLLIAYDRMMRTQLPQFLVAQ